MARRQQRRRPAFRPPPGARADHAADQAAIDAGARRLLATHDARSLQSLVNDLRLLRDEADRAANDQPSPEALRQYRRSARELAEAERALALSTSDA
jgi:hypothetical protein